MAQQILKLVPQRWHRTAVGALAFALAGMLLSPGASAAAQSGEALVNARCVVCHQRDANGEPSRLKGERKAPEAWLMTVNRMEVAHSVRLTDDERSAIVKYLADTRGLAPSEATQGRYALEQRLNYQEDLGDHDFTRMCARCHSGARILLSRYTQEEWDAMIDFHLGQWPTTEYQDGGRDRAWYAIAHDKIAPYLAKTYPFENADWDQWKKDKPAASTFAGSWSFSGHVPTQGGVSGVMTVTGGAGDQYDIKLDGRYTDGKPFSGKGSAIVYTGYEWRGEVTVGGVHYNQVLRVLDGKMDGRMFVESNQDEGLDFIATSTKVPALLSVQPENIRAGTSRELTLVGAGLSGLPYFGSGVVVDKIVENTPTRVRVKVHADKSAAPGARTVAVGKLKGPQFAVYDAIRKVKVVPDFAIARVGDNGGRTDKLTARFDAEAWGRDAKGKDFRIGYVPATWSATNFDAEAAKMEDAKFVGVMAKDGVFNPAGAGPNPERPMMTNNAGHLKVIASVTDGSATHTGDGELFVTVPKWIHPPIP